MSTQEDQMVISEENVQTEIPDLVTGGGVASGPPVGSQVPLDQRVGSEAPPDPPADSEAPPDPPADSEALDPPVDSEAPPDPPADPNADPDPPADPVAELDVPMGSGSEPADAPADSEVAPNPTESEDPNLSELSDEDLSEPMETCSSPHQEIRMHLGLERLGKVAPKKYRLLLIIILL